MAGECSKKDLLLEGRSPCLLIEKSQYYFDSMSQGAMAVLEIGPEEARKVLVEKMELVLEEVTGS